MVSVSLKQATGEPPSAGWRSVFGSWEFGLLLFMAALYLVGVWINPRFFGDTGALGSILRDAARYGVIAVGMTFVIVNKDLDLSVGSTVALTSAVYSLLFAPNFMDLGPWLSLLGAVAVGVAVGLVNGVLVTYLRVPAFIATLTMLFIGRGLVLGPDQRAQHRLCGQGVPVGLLRPGRYQRAGVLQPHHRLRAGRRDRRHRPGQDPLGL